MKERPILFSGKMVRAILDGRKTQTRRIVKKLGLNNRIPTDKNGIVINIADPRAVDFCPYGSPGDRLWVRETFLTRGSGKIAVHRAGVDPVEAAGFGAMYGGWKPSIHMPREASRITLEITGVRVERVQDITEKDAKAEGINLTIEQEADFQYQVHKITDGGLATISATRATFGYLWDSINKKRGFGWNVNPWVWVIEFRRIDR